MGNPIKHKLIAGILCLDFMNTINGHHSNTSNEYLNNCNDLILWTTHAGLFDKKETDLLFQQSNRHPKNSAHIFNLAIELREMLFSIFSALYSQKPVSKTAIQFLSDIHHKNILNSNLVQKSGRFKWEWKFNIAMEMVLWPITLSATRLLTSENLKWVRECSGLDCDWYFLDTSRNHQRRWCSMEDCGNRHKMKQRYIRRKKSLKKLKTKNR
jgi:predicted RNA-binding Zn ribbon-like protein